jgi:site-specific DNA-methyltransferase (adenine-specific)
MRTLPDKAFDIAIVDPPYGAACDLYNGSSRFSGNGWNNKIWGEKVQNWNVNQMPGPDYFVELSRVAKHRIIWGGNYFPLPPSSAWLVWDKMQREFSLADGELAWTSFNSATRIFSFSRAQAMQSHGKNKFHPTAKPVELYKWIIKNYCKPGWRIIDTHAGSASSLIAAYEFGLDYVGCELDPDYYKAACERVEKHKAQMRLFAPGFDQ